MTIRILVCVRQWRPLPGRMRRSIEANGWIAGDGRHWRWQRHSSPRLGAWHSAAEFLTPPFVDYNVMPSHSSESDGNLERVKGIEPSSIAWKAIALPLSYTRVGTNNIISTLDLQMFPGCAAPAVMSAMRQPLALCTFLVETDGLEPTTLCLQGRRSPN